MASDKVLSDAIDPELFEGKISMETEQARSTHSDASHIVVPKWLDSERIDVF
ncbi:hypothetical protein [Rhizobium tubonense]|uniref:hypothetical protein n=1 Tax=Rhizobium tubonense TaxID=484088 RepID=UPI0012B6AAA5|nr:hypothetical protein [Rhizobium tubonense]